MRKIHPKKVAEAQKRLVKEALRMKGFIISIVGASLISGMVILIQMYSLSILIEGVFTGDWTSQIRESFTWILIAAILVRAVMAWTSDWLGMLLAVRLKSKYRKRLIHRLHEMGPVGLANEKTGDLIGLQMNGIEKLDDFFSQYIPAAIHMATVPILIFTVVLWLDWPSGVVLMVTGPLIPFFMYLIGTKAEEKIRQQWSSFRRLNAHFLDTIQGMDTLKLFGREKSAERSINHISRMFRVTTMRVLKVAFLSGMVLELAASVSTAVVAVEIGVRLIEGLIGFQVGMFVLLLAPEFYLPFRRFGSAHHAGMEGAEAGARLFELFDTQNKAESDAISFSQVPKTAPRIELKNITFTYPKTERPVLKSLNLILKPGEIHTITGTSGQGKTTLLYLMGRLAEPDTGSILVNNVPLRDISVMEWRKQISFIPQFPHSFPGSVAENIKLGNAMASDEEIEQAARQALAHQFIRELPEGYDTLLGENGMNLSGGERQRLAMARVFLAKSPILLLDEPASSLHSNLESELIESLKKFSGGRIVLMVTHRATSILASDRLSILDDGAISESGTPDQLLPLLTDKLSIERGNQDE